jgi:hypothetical protein
VLRNPADMTVHFFPESLAKSRLLVLVMRCCVLKFVGCLWQNDKVHDAKRRSTRANTCS